MKTPGRVHPRRPHVLTTALGIIIIVAAVYWTHGLPARAQELSIVRFEAANYNFDEPEPGPATSQVTIAVELSAASTSTVSVQVYSEDVTAIDGQDHIGFDRTVTFPPGTTRRELSITLLGNDHVEETERFMLKMRNPAGARFAGNNEGQVTINDSDEYAAWLSYPSAVLEGESMPITLHFSHVVEYAVTLKVLSGEWTSDSHAATSGQDYDHFSGNIRLEAYQHSKTFNFPTNDDNEKEGWEVLALSLLENGCQRCNLLTPLNPSDSSQPLWIADEDIAPGMYLTSEFTKPTSNFHKKVIPLREARAESFDIWLSRQPTSPVTVRLEKTGDRDLTASPSSHTFTPENWGNPFRVSVEAGADTDVYDGTGRVSFTTDTDDPLYSRENLSYVNLSERDTTTDTTGRRTFSQDRSDDADRLTVELAHAPKRHNGEDNWVILDSLVKTRFEEVPAI